MYINILKHIKNYENHDDQDENLRKPKNNTGAYAPSCCPQVFYGFHPNHHGFHRFQYVLIYIYIYIYIKGSKTYFCFKYFLRGRFFYYNRLYSLRMRSLEGLETSGGPVRIICTKFRPIPMVGERVMIENYRDSKRLKKKTVLGYNIIIQP